MMAISGDYTTPIIVNGFSCRNCSDVARAEKNIDPAKPNAGPFGVNDPNKTDRTDAHKTVFDAQKIDETIATLDAQVKTAPQPIPGNPYAATAPIPSPGQLVSLLA